MSTQRITNKRRVLAETANRKVQYPRGVVSVNPLLASENCFPDYSVLSYVWHRRCKPCPSPLPIVPQNGITYVGGGASASGYPYDAGNASFMAGSAFDTPTISFDGNGTTVYDGGSA